MQEIKKVSLVGAGIGDTRHMTLQALKCIQNADVIIYDNLLHPSILNLARTDAILIFAGKSAGNHHMSQEEINETIIYYAKTGKYTIRLKGGDPYVFGRGAEEALALVHAGIAFEVIHGISSHIAALGMAGIPITHRGLSSSFHVFTGHESRKGEKLDYATIASLEGTLVFLMGISHVKDIVEGLISSGKSADTPVAIIEKGGSVSGRVFRDTLAHMGDVVEREKILSPAIFAIGQVCQMRELDFFCQSEKTTSVSGKRVLVTASRILAKKISHALQDVGVDALEMSLIENIAYVDWLDIEVLKSHTWIVFTSANGVRFFFETLLANGIDIRRLSGKKFAVIGEGTKDTLRHYGIHADLMPDRYTGVDLGVELAKHVQSHERVGIYRVKDGSMGMIEILKQNHILFDDISIYETKIDRRRSDALHRIICDIDYVFVASASAVIALDKILERTEVKEQVKLISIGPMTSYMAQQRGFHVMETAKNAHVESMIQAMIKAEERKVNAR